MAQNSQNRRIKIAQHKAAPCGIDASRQRDCLQKKRTEVGPSLSKQDHEDVERQDTTPGQNHPNGRKLSVETTEILIPVIDPMNPVWQFMADAEPVEIGIK